MFSLLDLRLVLCSRDLDNNNVYCQEAFSQQ